MSYHDELNYLYSLQKYGIKFGLSATRNLLQALGNPQFGRRYIHIAGTNGKGSVATFLASILQHAGLKVGLYTSPHLVRFTERFLVDFREIEQERVIDLVHKVRAVMNQDEPPTFFEAVTAMALTYFSEEETDLDIIETGMGGRLDATNLIIPLISVITNISLEHQDFLGDSLEAIAEEKAGIIKDHIPVVSGAEQESVLTVLNRVCREKQTSLYLAGRDFHCRRTGKGLSYFGLRRNWSDLEIGLLGEHQHRNAALALAGVELLAKAGMQIPEAAIRSGLRQAKWPGRMHLVSTRPHILVDGAHNTGAVKALAEALRAEFTYSRLILVIGIMADKEAGKILGHLLPLADRVIYTRPVYERAMEPEVLQEQGMGWKKPGEVVKPLSRALQRARELAGEKDLILVTGSLFTVGEALSCLDPVAYAPE